MVHLISVVGFVAAVSAIDAVAHTDSEYCEGRWVGCLNLNPNTCCSFSQVAQSIRFDAIPAKWYIEARSYRRSGCDESAKVVGYWHGRYGAKYCSLGNFGDRYWSVGYGFPGRKRGVGGVGDDDDHRVVGRRECEAPNAMGMGDGTRWNLTAMGDDLVTELMGYKDARRREDVPELFKRFEM